MTRGISSDNIERSLGLGPHLVGKQVDIHGRTVEISKQLGEGGFSFVYLVNRLGCDQKDADPCTIISSSPRSIAKCKVSEKRQNILPQPYDRRMVLKITSIHNASQRHMAEHEAKLLQMLSHPSIVQVYDHGLRECQYFDGHTSSNDNNSLRFSCVDASLEAGLHLKFSHHLILMEYCEGGTAFDAIKRMKLSPPHTSLTPANERYVTSQRFDLPSLVISFGQICNAVSYLHAQRPPIIHRDLKPVNFLIKNGAYKLCDFGSSVVGHTDLRTPESRRRAEEVINKTTTQMFRAPEMVDLYMAKRLTQSTDVWALGCCLYSLAFLCDCFEEGSNLAILSRKFKIPEDNPYGESLVDLIDRMLACDYKKRADMSEVITCLSALYSNRPLPDRRWAGKSTGDEKDQGLKMGSYRTDGQGICPISSRNKNEKRLLKAKKLNPNSAAAKRKQASHRQQENEVLQPKGGNTQECCNPYSLSSDGEIHNFATFDQRTLDFFCRDESSSVSNCPAHGKSSNLSSAFQGTCQISEPSSSLAIASLSKSCIGANSEALLKREYQL